MITFNCYGKNVGEQKFFDDAVVVYVDGFSDIEFRKYTRDYSGYADRKYWVRKINRRYKTLESAVRALIKSSKQPEKA